MGFETKLNQLESDIDNIKKDFKKEINKVINFSLCFIFFIMIFLGFIGLFIATLMEEDYHNGIINIYNNTGEIIATYENIENLRNCGDGVISFYCDGEKYYYCNCSMEIITNEKK